MTEYDGGFRTGDEVKVNGTPLHNQKKGVVIDWDVMCKTYSDMKLKESRPYEHPTRRKGLVPVFMPEFPETFYWWFAPHQLEMVVLSDDV